MSIIASVGDAESQSEYEKALRDALEPSSAVDHLTVERFVRILEDAVQAQRPWASLVLDCAKRQGQRQVALACLKRNGRRHRSGRAANVAADEDYRTDLGYGATEARKDRRYKVRANDHQDLRNGL